jgi:hypothetical protein
MVADLVGIPLPLGRDEGSKLGFFGLGMIVVFLQQI